MDLLPDESTVVLGERAFFTSLVDGEQPSSVCLTFCDNDRPIMFGGWWEPEPGLMRIFIVPGRDALRRPRALVHQAKWWIRHVEQNYYGLTRIETYCVPQAKINRWMEFLGFCCEGKLQRYTEAGQEYQVWSKVKVDGVWRGHTS